MKTNALKLVSLINYKMKHLILMQWAFILELDLEIYTESRNHGMAWVGRDLKDHEAPTPLLQAVPPCSKYDFFFSNLNALKIIFWYFKAILKQFHSLEPFLCNINVSNYLKYASCVYRV